jgi:uncharacterized protein (DUF433 family)
MTTQTLDRHIVSTPGILGGKPRIAGRRISVEHIAVLNVRLGRSVDDICTDFDLSMAEVHAALAYYFDHQAEIDKSIADGEAFVAEMKAKTPSILAEKLAERRR